MFADYRDTELRLNFATLSPTVGSTRSLGYILTLAVLPGRADESTPVLFSSEVSRLVSQLLKFSGLRGERQDMFSELVERFGAEKLNPGSHKAAMNMRWGPSDVQLETSVLKVEDFEQFLIEAIAQQVRVLVSGNLPFAASCSNSNPI